MEGLLRTDADFLSRLQRQLLRKLGAIEWDIDSVLLGDS